MKRGKASRLADFVIEVLLKATLYSVGGFGAVMALEYVAGALK